MSTNNICHHPKNITCDWCLKASKTILKAKFEEDLIEDLHEQGISAIDVNYNVVLKLIVKHYKVESIDEKMFNLSREYNKSSRTFEEYSVFFKEFLKLSKEKLKIEWESYEE